jgi:Transposase DDE domain
MKKDITNLYVVVDDFCKEYGRYFNALTLGKNKQLTRTPCLEISEIMTIILLFHQSPAKNFKYFYNSYLQQYLSEFPKLPRYNRFVELQQRCLGHFHALLMVLCAMAKKTGLSYVDSTCMPVCHHKRISRHKVFKGLAALGKSSMGWFFGFKLHLVISEKGELLNVALTSGNVDDCQPVRAMTKHLFGLLFGDKGYIDHTLFADLIQRNLKLVTGIKAKMKNKLMILKEKILLRKRSIIETVNSVLKKDFQVSHTRHRSFVNGLIHIFSTLVAYVFKSKKPTIKFKQLIPN